MCALFLTHGVSEDKVNEGVRIGTAHPCHYHVANVGDDGIDRATIVVATAVAQCKVARYLADLFCCHQSRNSGYCLFVCLLNDFILARLDDLQVIVIQLGRRTATVKSHQPALSCQQKIVKRVPEHPLHENISIL